MLSFVIFAFTNLIMSNELLELFEEDILITNEHENRRILENENIIDLDENHVLGNEWQNKTKTV